MFRRLVEDRGDRFTKLLVTTDSLTELDQIVELDEVVGQPEPDCSDSNATK